MSGGFLLAIIATVVIIVLATPEYALPAAGAAAPAPSLEAAPAVVATVVEDAGPTSRPPDRLKGYRWPVRGGGLITRYYDWDKSGHFSIDGRRVNTRLRINWFPGAAIKAAHRGKVVAAGHDWAKHVGYEDSMKPFYKRLRKRGRLEDLPLGIVIDDGNGYHSVYTNLKELRVKPGDKVKAGTFIGEMGTRDKQYYIEYQLVRMDGDWMRVAGPAKKAGYPAYAHEHVDPLAVLKLDSKHAPDHVKVKPPKDPPRLSSY